MTPTREERRLRRREVYLPKGVLLATLTKTFARSVIRVRQEARRERKTVSSV